MIITMFSKTHSVDKGPIIHSVGIAPKGRMALECCDNRVKHWFRIIKAGVGADSTIKLIVIAFPQEASSKRTFQMAIRTPRLWVKTRRLPTGTAFAVSVRSTKVPFPVDLSG